jgi:Flp pilus assembly protein TadG
MKGKIMRILLKSQKQEGAAVVEFAIITAFVLPLLMAGIIEFGLLLYNKQVITNSSRIAARAAVNPEPNKLDSSAIQTIVQNYCSQKLISFGGPQVPTVTLLPNSFSNRTFGDDVTVTVEYTYNFLMPFIIGLGTTMPLSAETNMIMM